MSAFIRCCLLIPILGPTAVCLLVICFNPGFVDSLPTLLFGLFLLLGIAVWLMGAAIGLFAKRSFDTVERIGNRRVFTVLTASSVIVYVVLLSISYWVNSTVPKDFAPRLVVIGVDGATWDLLDPWMQSGDLPHFQSLCENGARGTLQSIDPMRSPRLWTSIATGVPAEQHGISGFFSSRLDLQAPRLWDICVRHQLKVGLFSWLVSWPPRDPFEFIIPSWMARTPETHPPDYTCIQEINLDQGRWGGEINPWRAGWQCIRQGARMRSANDSIRFFLRDRFGLSEEARLAEKMLSHVRLKTDMFLALMRQYSPQVAAFNLYGSDKLAHRFWHYMDEESFPNIDPALRRAWGDVIHRYYQETDRALGQILNILPKDCTVLLVSDHGFKADLAAPRQFFLNIGELLDTLDYRDFFHHSTIERRAILDPIVDDEDFIEEMISRLNDIHFKDDDEPVFLTEIDEEGRIVLRTNFSVTWHPESPLLTNDTIVIENQVFPVSRLFFDRTFSGTHDPAGVVLLAGPAIVPGAAIQDAGLLDIAPTALYLLDLPISRELPGRILQEAFTQDYRETRVPRYVERYDPLPPIESDETQIPEHYLEHLRSLNYAQ